MPLSCVYEIAENLTPKHDIDIDIALRSKFFAAMAKVRRPRPKKVEIWEDDKASNSYKLILHFKDGSEYPFAIEVKKMRGDPTQPPNHMKEYYPEESSAFSQGTFTISADTTTDIFTQASVLTGVGADADDGTVLVAGSEGMSRQPPNLSLTIVDQPFRGGSLDLDTPDVLLDEEEIKAGAMNTTVQKRGHRRDVSLVDPSADTSRNSTYGEIAEYQAESGVMSSDSMDAASEITSASWQILDIF